MSDQSNSEGGTTVTPPAPTDAPKTFTQEQLEAVLKERLEREKTSSGHAQKQLQDTIKGLEESNQKYHERITKSLEKQLEALPESVRALVQKLDPLDQLEWLETNSAEFTQNVSQQKSVKPVPDGVTPETNLDDVIKRKAQTGDYSL
jgi:exonuclease VII large subunit